MNHSMPGILCVYDEPLNLSLLDRRKTIVTMNTPSILIIDDDPNLRKTLADILRAKGYELLAAKNGTEGLALLERNAVNLVLIDLGLPDISGIDVLHRVKADYPATEAIILTGSATLDSAIEATNHGAFSYLFKPYDIDKLLLHIRRALEKQQLAEEIVRYNSELESSNAVLKALFEVSQAISRTLDMKELLSEILHALVHKGIFPFEMQGVIFLTENRIACPASFVSLSDTVVKPCEEIRRGQCLCGQAMATGEIVISRNDEEDGRHARCHPDAFPHGRIVVPLKAVNRIVGLLCLFTKPDMEVTERQLKLFAALGDQIGIAISNVRLYEEMKSSSLHDPLTGLANRRLLEIELEKIIDSANRYDKPLSVIILDIDHFKKFNDTRGHVEGDGLLAMLAGILVKDMRNADHVFRYGGEEFLVILPDTSLTMACKAAERLRKAVEAEAGVTISLGVALYRPAMNDKALINKADEALYRAKEQGRNRVERAVE